MAARPARSVDVNLLIPLHALLEEANVTHAGARLLVSQPAVSGSLARLRRHFDDELLVRSGRGYELTPLAEKLRPIAAGAVAAVERVFGDSPRFVPDSAQRTFAISLTGYAMTVLAAPLVRVLSQRAPGVGIDFAPIPTDPDGLALHLLRRDLIVGPPGFGIPGRQQPLFTDRFVCVVARGNPWLHDGALTIADLGAMPHAVARFGLEGTTSTPDSLMLEAAGVIRDVRVLTAGLLTLPQAVAGTELCAFVPQRLSERCSGTLDLVTARTPLSRIVMVEAAHWHPSRADDAALSWFRAVLHEVAVILEDERAWPER